MEDLVAMDLSFWQGKNVFVTGHTGFKGAWLTAALLKMGARVTGYALKPPTDPSLFDILGLQGKITHIEADIRDRARIGYAMEEAVPDIAFHLAAQPMVRGSYADPLYTMDTNVTGTLNLLEGARGCESLRALVVITTDKCYFNDDTGEFFKEDAPLGGKDPYSASKAAAEIITRSYYESFLRALDIPVATARAGNVFGGGDWGRERLIPDAVRAAQIKTPVVIRNPKATRPWQHVLEPVRGYMMLAEKLATDGHAFAGGWNFGPETADIRSVEAVLAALQKIIPFDIVHDASPQPHEAKLLALDITKAKEKLGWTPRLGLDEALRWAGEWYKNPGADITRRQITEYFT